MILDFCHMGKYPVFTYFLGVQETSVHRQMQRSEIARQHNKKVVDAGAGRIQCALSLRHLYRL